MQTVPESSLYSIFSNVEVLVGCNQEMLRGLGDKMEGKEGVDVTIGEVFTKLVRISLLSLLFFTPFPHGSTRFALTIQSLI